MALGPVRNDPADLLASVSFITEVPAEEIEHWVVVAVKHDDTFRVGSDLCCAAHAVMVLAATAADLSMSVGEAHHALSN
jgi:hypothetical protein